MRVVVFAPHYVPAYRGGGPIRTLAAMVAQHGDRIAFRVVTGDHDWGEARRLDVPGERWTPVGRAAVWYAHTAHPLSWGRAYAQVRRLRPDVLYLNGLFPTWTSIVPLVLRRAGLLTGRVVLAPRGELGAGALALKAGKKATFLRLARAVGLLRGVVWHASTPLEADEVRAAVPGARVVVRENESTLPARASVSAGATASAGVTAPARTAKAAVTSADGRVAAGPRSAADVHPTPPEPADHDGSSAASTPPGRLQLAYVGRVSPKKGVDVVLAALAHVDVPVHLVVAGAGGDPAYTRRCDDLAAAARTRGHVVEFRGAVAPEAVTPLFASADVFAFPTAHENFGHTIAEALSVGCPVLLPDTTPWTPWVAGGGGEVVDGTHASAWAEVIRRWAGRTPDDLADARHRAARAYDAWSAHRDGPSVFDLLP